MRGHCDGDRRRLAALLAPTFQRQPHCVRVRHVARECLQDGGLKFGGAIAVEQPLQTHGDGAEIDAALGGADQQILGGGRGLRQAVGGAVLAGGTLAVDQGLDMGGVLDLRALVVAAAVAGQDVRAVDDTQVRAGLPAPSGCAARGYGAPNSHSHRTGHKVSCRP